jgi:broad specificity phosphatase PhoE
MSAETTQPLTVYFVRHGEVSYTEEEITDLTIEGTLTDNGRDQAQRAGTLLADQIDNGSGQILILTSPKKRAAETADIIEGVFQEHRIQVTKRRFGPLRDIGWGKEFVAALYRDNALGNLMEYWVDHADSLTDAESPIQVRRRVGKVIGFLEGISRSSLTELSECRRPPIICVCHEEIFRDLLETGFGFGTREQSGARHAEIMRMDIYNSGPNTDAQLKLIFRDNTAELGFNIQEQDFYKARR